MYCLRVRTVECNVSKMAAQRVLAQALNNSDRDFDDLDSADGDSGR